MSGLTRLQNMFRVADLRNKILFTVFVIFLFRIEYHVVNLSTLDGFDAGAEVTPDTLRASGLVAKQGLVKILARGELTKSLTVRAHAFSAAAVQAIEAAGGSTEVLPLPWPTGRPPARGNALTNR